MEPKNQSTYDMMLFKENVISQILFSMQLSP